MFIAIYAAKGKWFFWDFDLQGLERYVFSNRSAHRATSGVMIFEFNVFTNLICHPTSGASGGKAFEFYVFTDRSAEPTPSGGDDF